MRRAGSRSTSALLLAFGEWIFWEAIMPPNGKCFVSQSECVGRFWLRESPQVVIQGNFHSLVGAKAVGSSGNHSNFVVESFDGAAGDLSFGSKPIQDEGLMSAQHPGHLFHRLQTAPHRPVAPIVEKGSRPDYGSVVPEVGKSLFQLPGPRGGQLAG